MKTPAVQWGAFILCLCYCFGFSAFPIAPVEGDGISLATGALQTIQHGLDGPRVDYGRETRPGILLTLMAVRWITGTDSYLVFSLLCLGAGVVYVVFAALFAARFTRAPAPVCGIAILVLFPDSTATVCVPDGVVVAACLGTIALYLLARTEKPNSGTFLLAGVLAGLAVLARADAVLLGPIGILFLLTGDGGDTLKKLAVFAGSAIGVSLIGIYGSGCSVAWILKMTHSVLSSPVIERSQGLLLDLASYTPLKYWAVFFPLLTIFLITLGTFQLIRRRQWGIVWIVVAWLLPMFIVYNVKIYARPLYYTVPAFAILCLSGFEGIEQTGRRSKLLLRGAAISLFVAQYVLGINIERSTMPAYPRARPTPVALGETEWSREPLVKVSVGIGSGGIVPTPDGFRSCSGLVFYPLFSHLHRRQLSQSFRVLRQHMEAQRDEQPHLLIFTSQWTTSAVVNKAAQDLGYSCREKSSVRERGKGGVQYVWRDDDHTITHICAEGHVDPWTWPGLFPSELRRDRILYVAENEVARRKIEKSGHLAKVVSHISPELMCLLEAEQ